MKKHIAQIVRRSKDGNPRLGTMEKYGRAVGRWFAWQDALYCIEQIQRIAPYQLAVHARGRGGTPIMVTMSHMTATYDLDHVLGGPNDPKDVEMWAGAAGWLEMNTLKKLRQDLMEESWQ